MNLVSLLMLYATIATFPLYFMPSGGPQISNAFFVLFCVSGHRSLLEYRLSETPIVQSVFRALACFVGIVIVVQSGAAMVYEKLEFLKPIAFYAYNFAYVYFVFVALSVGKHKAEFWVNLGVITAVGFAVVGAILGYTNEPGRASSFFNNPNQLGYFGLISTTLLMIFRTRVRFRFSDVLSIACVLCCVYLCTISLSKAAIIASVIQVALLASAFTKKELAVLGLIGLMAAPFAIPKVMESREFKRAQHRIESIGQDHDDNLSSRGYHRITNYPEYLLTGAGEGYYWRFRSTYEIHATFANILFSFGGLGTFAFVVWGYRTFRVAPILFMVTFTGVVLYGLTHNGIRSTYLWLLVAVFLHLGNRLIELDRTPSFSNPDGHDEPEPAKSDLMSSEREYQGQPSSSSIPV